MWPWATSRSHSAQFQMLQFDHDPANTVDMPERRSRFARYWQDGHRQARRDMHNRGKSFGIGFFAFVWFAGLLSGLCVLITSASLGGVGFTREWTACLPDGTFGLKPTTYSYWSNSGFFEITLGFGSLSFTEAKVIDVFWDVFIGRGGQALLIFTSWKVFAHYVTVSMEVAPITFRAYRTVFMPNKNVLMAIPSMVMDFLRGRALQSKMAICFIVFTMAFTVVFPTFAGAMTGYSANAKAYINATDGNFVPFDAFRRLTFIIHDGSRVNLTDDYAVPYYDFSTKDPIVEDNYAFLYISCENSWGSTAEARRDCYLFNNITNYVAQYGFFGSQDVKSDFWTSNLDPPILNISAFYLPDDLRYRDILGQSYFRDGIKNFQDESRMKWKYQDNAYSMQDLKDRGKCQPLPDYQWGFSFIQLIIMVILLLIWVIGIYILWLRTHIIMKKRGITKIAGENQAILELAHAIQEQVVQLENERGLDKTTLSESTLQRRIDQDLGGGSISYAKSVIVEVEEGCTNHVGFWGWLKKDKWWLTGMCFAILVSVTCGLMSPIILLGFISLPLEIAFAMVIGTTKESRAILLFWSFMLLTVVLELAVGIPFIGKPRVSGLF